LIKLDPAAAQCGDCNGDTAVHLAAEMGRLDMLRAMGDKLGELDFLNHRGETPLMYAAHGGHMASVIALVEDRGNGSMADAGKVDAEGKSVLMHACSSGHLDLVNLILQNREGRHPNLKFPLLDVNHCDQYGTTALHVAASEGYWQVLPSLVLAGANKAAKDNDGCTPLHTAAIEDEVLSIATLLDIGVDANVGDIQGWTPLMHAAWNGADEVVRLLVDAGARLDERNCDGDTALQICLRRYDVVKKMPEGKQEEARDLVKRTSDLLTDGLLDHDFHTTHSVDARGHFMVTVVGADNLYHEGKADNVNSYVYLELCTKKGDAPVIAFSTCIASETDPNWHETFRFDTEAIDPTAYLAAWVISAPGENFFDIVQGAQRGLTEKELHDTSMKLAVAGVEARQGKPDFNKDLMKMLKRQTNRNDRFDDVDVFKQNAIARMPKKPALSTYQRAEIPLLERRWNDVMNLRQTLQRTGCDIHEPLVPRTHMPVGCVIARFRHLRQAVWGVNPTVMNRRMRLACKGGLCIEIDFRPRYFIAVDPLAALTTALEFAPRTPRAEDLEETAETAALAARESKPVAAHGMILTGAPPEDARGGREAMRENPLELYRKYQQVTVWAGAVLDARKKLEGDVIESSKDTTDHAAEGLTWVMAKERAIKKKYEAYWDKKDKVAANLDRQVAAVAVPPAGSQVKAATVEAKPQPGSKDYMGKIPAIRVEPWLEDILDGSRFV